MIELKHIWKKFGHNAIFKDLNLSINQGEMIAIMGNSGSGKSTLLNIIGLIEKPDEGEVIINNQKIEKLESKQVILAHRNLIGYIFQNFALVDNETVSKNLDIALMYVDGTKIQKEEKKKQALEYVGIPEKMNSKIFELSGGEQQRVALARVILKPCEIILADEPTGSLDEKTAADIISILKKLNSEGKTIIIVTHDPSIANNCNKIYHIENKTIGTSQI